MTSKELLYALNGVGDDLLTAPEGEGEALRTRREPAAPRRRVRRYAWTAAAFAAAAALAFLALPGLRPQLPAQTAGPEQSAQIGAPLNPASTDAPEAKTPPELVWNVLDSAPSGTDPTDVAGVVMVGEPLTAEQLARCAPERLPEGLRVTGSGASYYLMDGSGGLAWVELRFAREGLTNPIQMKLWMPERPPHYDCVLEPIPEETEAGVLEGLSYRAYQYAYLHGEGDPEENPPERWLSLSLRFARCGAEYQLVCETPEREEQSARDTLSALLRAYAESETGPELDGFRCGEYVCRDETLSPEAARSDPDFGAYFPQSVPEGMVCDRIRRYQFQDGPNYLYGVWAREGQSIQLEWLISVADEETQSRLVQPEQRKAYDLSLYPGAWYTNAPAEVRDRLERPVFPAETLTEAMIAARQRYDPNLDVTYTVQFDVLYESGITVRVSGQDLDAGWIYETLQGMK